MALSFRTPTVATFTLVLLAGCGKLAEIDLPSGERTSDPGYDAFSSGSSSSSSSSSGSSSGSSGAVTIHDPVVMVPPKRNDLQLQTLASQHCASLAACAISGDAILVGTWGDQESCAAATVDRLATELAAKGVTVTQAQIDACTARKALNPCEGGLVECMFTGSLANGAACQDSEQCESGDCRTEVYPCGHCVARVPAGGDCSHGSCAIGLRCTATNKCTTPLPGGAACNADSICGFGLSCRDGKCAVLDRLPVGSPCETDPVGSPPPTHGVCVEGSWCESQTQVCTLYPKSKATANIGDPCGESVFCRGSDCNKTTGRCEARPPQPPVTCN